MNQLIEWEGTKIRVVGTPENPEWVAADVCQVLGLENPSRAMAKFKQSERGGMTIGNTPYLTVTEPGLYRLIFKSRKPEADRFRTFVTHEVLPSIRRHGCYPPPELVHQQTALIRIDEEALGRAIGHHMGVIRDDLHEFKEETRNNFAELRTEVERIGNRRELKQCDKRFHVQVVYRQFGGLCPCCGRRRIVNSHGEKLSCLHFDHWKLPSINSRQWTWPVCDDCNMRLRDGDFHLQTQVKFDHYQETRIRLENMISPCLPGIESV